MPTKVPNRKKKPGVLGTTNGGTLNDSAMDEYLAKRGLYRKPIAKDGSCLFRAVSEQVHNCQARHIDVRNQCIAFMRQNREQFEEFVEGPFDHHLFKLQNPKEWAGQVEITALSQLYSKDFVVYQDINCAPTKVTDHGYKDKILLCYSNGNHYDIIYPSQFQEHAAMCQSLLYEMIYNKVFNELSKKEKKGKQKGANTTEHSQTNQKSLMEWVNGCTTDGIDAVENSGDDDGWTEVKSKARAKHERLSKPVEADENKDAEESKSKPNDDQKHLWELRRSVDPHLYRNISLEVWEEEKNVRQQQDLTVAATLQYKNNDRCLVKLWPPNAPIEKNYSAIIKEDYSGSGNILVYIPELKEKQVVSIHYVKLLDNQHGHNYKDLSGYYKKEESANTPEDGAKDDTKNKKKRPPRPRRGPGKGGDDTGNVSEDAPRGRGRQRERYGNRRRFPNSKDDKSRDEEEAKFIAEQIKLVELQEKDPKAFPALPVRASSQVSPTAPGVSSAPQSADVEMQVAQPTQHADEKSQEKDKNSATNESSPAAFWSRLLTKPVNEPFNQANSPVTSPTARKPENQAQQAAEEREKDVLSKRDEESLDKKEQQESSTSEDVKAEPVIDKHVETPSSHVRQTHALDIQPAQLKPLLNDVKHSKAAGQVYEVKIPQPAKLMQQAKLSPPPTRPTQPPTPSQPDSNGAEKNTLSSLVELHDRTQPIMKEELSEDKNEMIIANISENQESSPALCPQEQPREPPSSTGNMNEEERFSTVEENNMKEEEAIKVNKTKVVDAAGSGATPEGKKVTFADKHKEIPAVPYGQSQKGILMLNGTNRPPQTTEQGCKSPTVDDYTAVTKESKLPQEATEKDLQSFPSAIANEGIQPSLSTTQQQNQTTMPFTMMPFIFPPPAGVQIPSGPSMELNGSDLPEDMLTLRYFFNLGYQQFVIMASQMNNPQMLYMYQGATMQDQMMQPSPQPVVSMYANMHHQQVAYQAAGLQNYQPAPFQMHSPMPPTSQDSSSLHDRTSERHQPHQHQAQQIPHQQQSGHFQPQQQQQQQAHFSQPWRSSQRQHYNNSNKPHVTHHVNVSQPQRFPPYSGGAARQQPHFKENNKQSRKPGVKNRNNDTYSPHYPNMSSQATPSQPTSFYIASPDQNKGPGHDYYPAGNPVMYNYHHAHIPSGMPPHSAGSTRGVYNN